MAVETTTLDLIKKEDLFEKNMPLYFEHANLDPGVNLHPFQRLFGPMKNPYLVTEFAGNLGMGSQTYELSDVLPAQETIKIKIPEAEFERQPSFY